MVLIGRLTKDASVKTLKDERKVINFSVAVNNGYKDKKTDKWVSIPSYFGCSYWLSLSIAPLLKKGCLVELTGRVSVNAYKDMEGEAQATLNYHVDTIKIHQSPKREAVTPFVTKEEVKEELAF
jgi:single-strand DNA-binding protein